MKTIKLSLLVSLTALFASFSIQASSQTTVDSKATKKTKALLYNLHQLAPKHLMFGHQDDMAYGVFWKESDVNRSDVKDVCGSFPAVFGWDLGKLGASDYNIDDVSFKKMRQWTIDAFKMGGMNTYSWHVDNFVTGGNTWDVGQNVVAAILPGGSHHQMYKERLDVLAQYFKSLKTGFIFKTYVPVVFRPFHEHTGGWFWWGQPHCTPDEYKALWRFTVEYLRDAKGVHNLLYSYSTDIFQHEEHYLECYPGDEYVDILGMDNYHDVKPENNPQELTNRLKMLVQIAESKGKVAALTETGLECIPEARWWTDRLLKYIQADPVASRIAWVLVWRNGSEDHHYAPYPGHVSAPNFIEFTQNPAVLMQRNLPKLYKR